MKQINKITFISILKFEAQVPRKSLPSSAVVHVCAASYNATRSSVMLYFFFSFLDTMYMIAAPAYFTVNRSVMLKFPAITQVLLHVRLTFQCLAEIAKKFL